VLDFFAGSGTAGAAAARNGREFLLVDENPAAIAVMEQRLAAYLPVKTEKVLKPTKKRVVADLKKKPARKAISVKSNGTRTKRGTVPPTDAAAT
jgi:DNA modification methylase